MREVMSEFVKSMGLVAGLNEQRVYAAWDAVSGAQAYTLSKSFRGGILYCTMKSSVVRNQLSFSNDLIIKDINTFLMNDELFVKDDPSTNFVRKLVLK